MSQTCKPTVLIVEDESIIRMFAAEAFQSVGFVVIEAEDAAEAIKLHADRAPLDLLFTDVDMPGQMTGVDLAECLQTLAPGLRIIVTSGLPLPRPIGHLAATFFAKPYDLDDVCSAAKALLAA